MNHGEIFDAVSLMNSGQLRALQRVVNARWLGLAQNAKAQFYNGCYVKFSDKHGVAVFGTVTKVCSKNVKVTSIVGMKWTVAPQLLTKVDALPGW